MEEKKVRSKKVAENTSSGAKKVERVEEEKTAQKRVSEKPSRAKTVEERVEEENVRAHRRIAAAKARAERKEHRKANRLQRAAEWKEKRLLAKERRAERRAQNRERAHERRLARLARKDMLKNETAIQRLERREKERAEKAALKKQNAEMRHELALRRREERAEKRRLAHESRRHRREQKTQRKARRTPGFGGWLAAVISLGVASLAMASIITVGALNMGGMYENMGTGYSSELYEMTELSENLNANLSKLRVSGGTTEQRSLLTDILVESELMESALQRFPVDMATTNNLSSFVNRTAQYAREGLETLAKGGTVETDETLEYIYRTNGAVLKELQTLRSTMTAKDWMRLVDGKKGPVQSGFENVNSNVVKTPSSIQDGPFSENKEKVTGGALLEGDTISSSAAVEKAREYFSDYAIREAEYKGDTNANGFTAYNITLRDERGREIYAQISKTGKLLMFNSYEDCNAHNFSQEECVSVAENFLSSLGIENMTPVWLQENGTTANVNFVYEQDGVLCYSDMIIVKVCETKGKAIGMEAVPYYLNHTERTIGKAAISQENAAQSLRIRPETARLALIPYAGSERLTYEFTGTYNGSEYFAYVDAKSGEELETFSVINTKQGRLLA